MKVRVQIYDCSNDALLKPMSEVTVFEMITELAPGQQILHMIPTLYPERAYGINLRIVD